MSPQLGVGAKAVTTAPPGQPSASRIVLVASQDDVMKALANARPGDVITLLPGTYRFNSRSLDVRQAGTKDKPIMVRAERLDTVFIELNTSEGFAVSAPYWTFENLNIRGVCKQHTYCEHAFHVVGNGSYFTARNNRITDFNAHFKINGVGMDFPDHGLIVGNTIKNESARQTGNAVTPIDLVAASHWRIRNNVISDFVKGGGDGISYGAFAKGAGQDNRFEQNVVLCEDRLRGAPGQRVGLSLGGGGTGKPFCRDKQCITEQDNSVIQSNLIAFCSDDGIYINRSATSSILHNTIIDTGGISVRFAESSADVTGNLVDGVLRTRDGGLMRMHENHETSIARLYLGLHPVRDLFVDAKGLYLKWATEPPRRSHADAVPPDLCGRPRGTSPAYGAFEDFSACIEMPRL
ncbi:MAG: right-handed parallel beta-helix repeat-containing protein [Noviherbaspirillum sp.]|nr:right-handed parallel beta-helix repeat-containing protein [Noviherbaspirillum sp.]